VHFNTKCTPGYILDSYFDSGKKPPPLFIHIFFFGRTKIFIQMSPDQFFFKCGFQVEALGKRPYILEPKPFEASERL
jgi:hypothetical protein